MAPASAVALLVVALAATGLGGCAGRAAPASAPALEAEARAAADRFLDRYLAGDGRVVRHDQGGDTVSEGQAYAMLLAAAVGDETSFAVAWGWARTHLRRADGLLSWRWVDGRVPDPGAATDADVDAAHALLVAARRFDRPGYAVEARTIARSVLARSTAPGPGSRPVLVAGAWARGRRPLVNPSYFAPVAFAALAATTGDGRWAQRGESSRRLTRDLTASPPRLPPDWARVDPSGATAVAAPGSYRAGPHYGFDAARLPVRFAADCSRAGRDLAAAAGRFLPSGDDPVAAVYGLQGRPKVGYEHPLGVVAAAAAAAAGGDSATTARRLDHAERLDADRPTYYGGAWVALGRVLLTTRLLGGCSPAAPSR
jgi:endo-1,4-beta-D-glucanase Y